MAKRIANVYQRKKKKVDGTVVILPHWWIKYRRHGQVFRESTGTTDYAQAKRLLKHHYSASVLIHSEDAQQRGVRHVFSQNCFSRNSRGVLRP